MKLQSLTVGLKVKHPRYGVGIVKSVSQSATEVRFDDALRTLDPELSELSPAEPNVGISGLEMPLQQFVSTTIEAVIDRLGVESPDAHVEQLGARWHKGKAVLHPADPTLQTKEVPMEVFFHKVVGIRNRLRTLEQQINASDLPDDAKVKLQAYITGCYGTLTSFNVLFADEGDHFRGSGGD